MQYIKTLDGWQELKNKNVDFGGGLERLTMVSSDMGSIFETDLFFPIISKIEDLSGKKYSDDIKSFEIVADHIKASCFILGDVRGVQPSNKQQGYFVRRLIRRAIVYGGKLGIESFGSDLAKEVVNIYKEYYPELVNNYDLIVSEIVKEEEKFRKTLNRGLKEFNKIESGIVSGKLAFDLYQTYGFPIEITKELAQEKGKKVDLDDFNLEMNKHKGLSQTASAGMFKGGLADSSESTTRLHTATHILLYSLRNILGDSVVQKGSNITKERLRFDFSFTRKPTEEELKRIENMVNEIIADDLEVVKENMPLAEALNSGALSFFGEKYPSVVSVYSIGKISKEICLGPHVKRTSELGKFKIIKEESSGEGVRRIKAVLG
jgi:alanyl-tRNA synthetase